jgi:hypothetical protein
MKLELVNVDVRAATESTWRLNKRTRVYFWPEGETSLQNLFEGRHSRPFLEFRRQLMDEVLRQAGLREQKALWSQKAGCSMCPCSPGFVLEDLAGYETGIPEDIHVTYRVIEEVATA